MSYKDSIFLPKTSFPMKAGLAQKEPSICKKWETKKLYKKLREQSINRPHFMLHFGPPYANGHIHIGHALSEVLKDIVNKSHQMSGFNAPLVPGWDCHGLPIEWKIEEKYRKKGKDKDQVDILVFRQECRDFAKHWMDIQREEFKRLGIIADFDNPYVTMDFKTESVIVKELGKFLMDGSLYQGQKPVLWSVIEKTALAEAEVEYKDKESDSIDVAFPIIKTNKESLSHAKVVIWTTTPWTIPANRAVAYGDDIDYVLIQHTDNKILVAKDLMESFVKRCGWEGDVIVLETFKGAELEGSVAAHPWRGKGYDFDVPLLPGDHVTVEAGTGFVHTAPTHGLEDFELGKKFGLEVPKTVAEDGRYYDHIPLFAGDHIYKVGPKVIEALENVDALMSHSKMTHSYPHSWRSKAPLIYRATSQWFISMETTQLRDKAMKGIDETEWFPKKGKNRISSMVETRPDWCISRQRAWGTPLTLFVHTETGEVLRDQDVHNRIVKAIEKDGGDAWYTTPAADFLGEKYNANHYEKVMDVIDVWFDSGCSNAYVLQERDDLTWPADVYFEGSDQHRGWFQSSLLHSCGANGKPPYKQVVTHGYVLDEHGRKMSKSLGNGVAPQDVIKTKGADMIRLWVAMADYKDDIRIGKNIIDHQQDLYRRYRNTLRYLLGALKDFDDSESVDYKDLPDLEKYVLGHLVDLQKLFDKSMKNHDYGAFYHQLHTFCSVTLSAFYFDIRKDCLYCDDVNDIKRRSNRTVMKVLFEYLTKCLAPVLSFTADEAWGSYQTECLKIEEDNQTSIHEQLFEKPASEWENKAVFDRVEQVRDLRRVMTGAIEVLRNDKTIRSSLEASLTLYADATVYDLLKDVDLEELSITSNAVLTTDPAPSDAFNLDDVDGLSVVVSVIGGEKCERCWKFKPEVGQEDRTHKDLCHRCEGVITR